jgi:hypothetical protein
MATAKKNGSVGRANPSLWPECCASLSSGGRSRRNQFRARTVTKGVAAKAVHSLPLCLANSLISTTKAAVWGIWWLSPSRAFVASDFEVVDQPRAAQTRSAQHNQCIGRHRVSGERRLQV